MNDIIRPKKRPAVSVLDDNELADADNVLPKQDIIPDSDIPEPKFVPPEQLADEEIMAAASEGLPDDPEPEIIKKTKAKRRLSLHMPHGKKQWAITILVILLLLSGGASAYWFGFHKTAPKAVTTVKPVVKKVPPKPTTEESKLSGLQVPIGTNLIPVTSVMIENSPEARPQSGLKDASVVFEAIAEGGITRFNALFQDTAPEYVGPIRSVRPYYLDWLWPFDASVAHVGGAPQAISDIKTLNIKDLDQFYNSAAYDRISSRYAPHNVYTSIARLQQLEKSKGFTSANFTGFTRKKEAKVATPTARDISLSISSYYFNVNYIYDPTTNTYLRSEGGEVHKDEKSNTQLAPKVVVAIVMSRGIDGDGQHTDYTTTGSGHMYVFQDGTVQEGTWSKDSRQAQWKFVDAAGAPIAFNPGQTWLSMVDTNGSVVYKP